MLEKQQQRRRQDFKEEENGRILYDPVEVKGS